MPAVRTGFETLQSWELMQRQCKALASSTLVPKEFQGNLPNCLIALEMAQRIGASPLMVMQNLYVVHGRPGWSAKFLIASFNQCGRFSAIRYEWRGERGTDAWSCRAWAVEKSTGERIEGPWISIELSKREGWYGKSGSKWQTIPELMLSYRAAAWLVNTHAPEISMGLNSAEEIVDVYDTAREPDGHFSVTVGDLRDEQPAATPDTGEAPAPADPQDAELRQVEQRSQQKQAAQQQAGADDRAAYEDAIALVKAGEFDASRQNNAPQQRPAATRRSAKPAIDAE